MREIPDGPDLLEIAPETLLREVVPRLPTDHRLAALMAANAMAIAARDARAGAQWESDLTEQLAGLLGMDGADEAALSANLVARIRAGQADPGETLHAPGSRIPPRIHRGAVPHKRAQDPPRELKSR